MTLRVTARALRAVARLRSSRAAAPLLAQLAFVAPAVGAQAVPAGFEQGIFELRAARIATETVPALLTPTGLVLIPLERAIALTGVPVRQSDSSVAVERARNGGWATLDLRARRITDASGAQPLDAQELVRVDGAY